MQEKEPIKLGEAGPTMQAKKAAERILEKHNAVFGWNEAAQIIDEEMGLKDLIGKHNELVQRYEDEHELRLRIQADLRALKRKLESFLEAEYGTGR